MNGPKRPVLHFYPSLYPLPAVMRTWPPAHVYGRNAGDALLMRFIWTRASTIRHSPHRPTLTERPQVALYSGKTSLGYYGQARSVLQAICVHK